MCSVVDLNFNVLRFTSLLQYQSIGLCDPGRRYSLNPGPLKKPWLEWLNSLGKPEEIFERRHWWKPSIQWMWPGLTLKQFIQPNKEITNTEEQWFFLNILRLGFRRILLEVVAHVNGPVTCVNDDNTSPFHYEEHIVVLCTTERRKTYLHSNLRPPFELKKWQTTFPFGHELYTRMSSKCSSANTAAARRIWFSSVPSKPFGWDRM